MDQSISNTKYSEGAKYEGGAAGGAGFGNKATDSFSKEDSHIGKIMEKVGNVTHSKHLVTHGQERRSSAGHTFEGEEKLEKPTSN
ncbi:hypothetical protein BT63DRAFT_419473 [Microthyrium microscopicum]|uniref:Uncharacterized protein n=1 Tax=Microthyrium microscopicum TaxID=703497 RepID=A0A6A6UQZ5_9PEZI|nr:hypothetical protein BT63DRAFT_419473 [Microthyrium microscopicum]